LDRIKTGALLYNAKKASKILITGDDGQMRSNEVAAMKKAVLDLGVKEQDVVIDGQGYRTYESCKRAKEVYKIDDMIVVTQRFHLGRALYLCNTFGVDAIGVSSDLQSYQNIVRHWVRDLLASNKAWYDINIEAPRSPVTNL
jgi:vancomycin permeability regulator SanA